MPWMTLDAQHLRDHLQLLAGLAVHFKTPGTADVRQVSRYMYERSFGTAILRHPFGDDVRSARFIPLGFDLEAGEITWSRAILCFHWSGHTGRPPLSAIGHIGPIRFIGPISFFVGSQL